MTEQKYIKGLSITVIMLVSLVTIISFVLSYEALWSFALAGGKSAKLAWLWPVIIDLPIIVFSVVALFAVVLGSRAWPFRVVVILVTAGTVYFNYSYAVSQGLSWQVYITAPIMYFVSFEVLVWAIKVVSERSVLITKIAEISAKLGVLEIEYKGRKDNLTAGLKRLERDTLAEIEANRLRLVSEIGQLESQQASLIEVIETKAKTLDSYAQDIEAKKQELKGLTGGLTKIYLPANLTLEQKQDLANQMANDGLTNEQIKDALGVSLATVKNYKKANRLIDPADVPVTTGGQNGKAH